MRIISGGKDIKFRKNHLLFTGYFGCIFQQKKLKNLEAKKGQNLPENKTTRILRM